MSITLESIEAKILATTAKSEEAGATGSTIITTLESYIDRAQEILDGAATLAGDNVFTGTVDLSEAASVTPPDDWAVNGITYKACTPMEINVAGFLQANCAYDMGTLTANADLSSMSFTSNAAKSQTCEIWFKEGTTLRTISWPAELVWLDGAPNVAPGLVYRISVRQEPTGTMLANVAYEYYSE